jgi:hypothetical protein
VENQHRKITGYRDLQQREIDAINKIKGHASGIELLLQDLEAVPEVDKRWLAVARTDLQKGFMAATRAIARPESF